MAMRRGPGWAPSARVEIPPPSSPSRDLSYNMAYTLDESGDFNVPRNRAVRATSLQQPRTLSAYRKQLKKVYFQGFLEKRSWSDRDRWERRFCVLSDGEFRYFHSKEAAVASGADLPVKPGALHGTAARPGEALSGSMASGVSLAPSSPYTSVGSASLLSLSLADSPDQLFRRSAPAGAAATPSEPPSTGARAAVDQGGAEDEEDGGNGHCIPLDQASAVRTVRDEENSFRLVIGGHEHVFRAYDRDEYQEWLFNFHSSILAIAMRIVDRETRLSPNDGFAEADLHDPARELGRGHGHHSPREGGRRALASGSHLDATRHPALGASDAAKAKPAFSQSKSLPFQALDAAIPRSASPEASIAVAGGPATRQATATAAASASESQSAYRTSNDGSVKSLGSSGDLFEMSFEDLSELGGALPPPASGDSSGHAQVAARPPLEPPGTGSASSSTPLPSSSAGAAGESGIRWRSGVYCEKGHRDKNEDTFTQVDAHDAAATGGGTAALYGVYDGHCGSEAADVAARDLHTYIFEHEALQTSPLTTLRDAFLRLDREFLELARDRNLYCGTTAIVMLLLDGGRRMFVSNVGDSAAVLCRGGQAVELSQSHKPDRPDEKERIAAANGWITEERELFMGQLHRMDLKDPKIRSAAEEVVQWVTISRVCGELAVSRSIGDPDFKGIAGPEPSQDLFFCFPQGHSRTFSADLVIAEPDIESFEVSPGDEFVVLASDGLWDVLNGQQVVDAVRDFQQAEPESTLDQVAHHLCRLALRLGSADNITVVVVAFDFDPS
uniref:PPM-type phosphatase domain-containing protein n=1 Tax=Rhizochromulina marina TaxID=1034831 RepID=A0A7S2REK4_9STRA|mmetsp:Transcript_15178/g.44924  ORF Transcript_15178/g.44924 Transcript_15178/m.44924 type:complete len:785 (+) Transcript_15178:67-2421(+)